MKLEIRIHLVCLGLCLFAVAWGTEGTDIVMKAEDVRHLVVGRAENDARKAIARGDRHLMAVYGLTLEVPGVSDDIRKLRQQYGLIILGGTSDAIESAQNRQMNLNARRYAMRYNHEVISASR